MLRRDGLGGPGGRSRVPRSRGGWSSFSRRRKLRLLRTAAIVLAILVLAWQCGGDEPPTKSGGGADRSTTTTTAASAGAPTGPTRLTAELTTNVLPQALYASNAASVAETIILAGGLDAQRTSRRVVWQFDPATGATANIATLPAPTRDAAVGVIGDHVFIAGGARGETTYDTVLSVSLIGELADEGKLPAPRSDGVAVTSEDGATLFVVGGYDGTNPTNEVLATTDGATFTPVATLSQPVRNTTAVVLGRSIWVIGGDWGDQEQSGVFRIDLDPIGNAAAGTVTQVADLPKPLTRAAAVVLGGTIFVIGGRSGGEPTDQILAVDPTTGRIADAGRLPTPTSDAVVGVVGSTAYLLGGQSPTPTDAIVALTPS